MPIIQPNMPSIIRFIVMAILLPRLSNLIVHYAECSSRTAGPRKCREFNLRFKTDSSKLGPRPGQPVAVGAGMQGDRASIVFASPKEISTAIAESCP